MRSLHILHLSDLHERALFNGATDERRAAVQMDLEERERVLGPHFLEALREISRQRIDLICMTGDVADWALPDEYSKAAARLEAILDATRVPRGRLFLVPGNHDIARGRFPRAWSGLRRWLAAADPIARHKLAAWFRGAGPAPPLIDRRWREQVLARSEAFWSFSTELCQVRPTPPAYLGYRRTLDPGTLPGVEVPIHVIGLDSAWLCGDDNDQGRLYVTETQVLGHASDGSGHPLPGFRLALLHHPLDHLGDQAHVRRCLADNVDLVLHGHQHEPVAIDVSEPGARLRILAAGCLMEGGDGVDWPNEFHLLEVDLEDPAHPCTVTFRKWAKAARSWVADTELYAAADRGVLHWGSEAHGCPTHERGQQLSSRLLTPEDGPYFANEVYRLLEARIPAEDLKPAMDMARWLVAPDPGYTPCYVVAEMEGHPVGFLYCHMRVEAAWGFVSYLVVKRQPNPKTQAIDWVSSSMLREVVRQMNCPTSPLSTCKGFLIELAHPDTAPDEAQRRERLARFRLFETLGIVNAFQLRALDVPYRQPPLSVDEDPEGIPHLLVLARPLTASTRGSMPRAEVEEILRTLYLVLYPSGYSDDVAENRAIGDTCTRLFQAVTAGLPDEVALRGYRSFCVQPRSRPPAPVLLG